VEEHVVLIHLRY